MQKILFLLILSTLFLNACGSAAAPSPAAPVQDGTAARTPTLVPALPSPASTPVSDADKPLPSGDELQQLMLFSHDHWEKAWIEAEHILYALDGSGAVQTTRYQFWLEHPKRQGRLLEGPSGEFPSRLWVSDGKSSQETGSTANPLPEYLFAPFSPPALPTDTIWPYPLAGILGSSISDMIYSTPLAQRGGAFRVIGREIFAGRQAVVVEWGPTAEMFVDRMWVDEATGIVLRKQNFGKAGTGVLNLDSYITQIAFDLDFAAKTYELNKPLPQAFASNPMDIP